MSATAWLALWAILLIGSLLVWLGLLRRTYRSFRNLQAEIRKFLTAINSVKAAKQTRLSTPDPASPEKGV